MKIITKSGKPHEFAVTSIEFTEQFEMCITAAKDNEQAKILLTPIEVGTAFHELFTGKAGDIPGFNKALVEGMRQSYEQLPEEHRKEVMKMFLSIFGQ